MYDAAVGPGFDTPHHTFCFCLCWTYQLCVANVSIVWSGVGSCTTGATFPDLFPCICGRCRARGVRGRTGCTCQYYCNVANAWRFGTCEAVNWYVKPLNHVIESTKPRHGQAVNKRPPGKLLGSRQAGTPPAKTVLCAPFIMVARPGRRTRWKKIWANERTRRFRSEEFPHFRMGRGRKWCPIPVPAEWGWVGELFHQ